MDYTVEHRVPGIQEYQQLRNSTGWEALTDDVVGVALLNTLFAVCVMWNHKLIGSGRIIGDGGAYFYIQDVIVLPDHQQKGVGTMIMLELEKWLSENTFDHSFIGLMAAEDVKAFYKKFGYKERDASKPGMYKTVSRE